MGEGLPWPTACTSPFAASLLLILLVTLPWSALARPATVEPTATHTACPSGCQCTAPHNGEEVDTISCAHGGLTSFPPHLPASLTSLDLGWNRITETGNLSSVDELQFLDLSNNALTALRAGSLDHVLKLTALDLSANAIESVEGRVFGSLAAMDTVSLAYNQLTSLNGEMLFGLLTVKVLNLTGNMIQEVSNQTFFYLHQLEILDLSHNSLEYLPQDAFQGLESVRTILLHHNHLVSISGAFSGLNSLVVLDVSHNALNVLESHTFGSLCHLSELKMSFNNITELSPTFCGNTTSVKRIDLRGNPIKQLEGGWFQHSPALQVLDLSQMPSLQSIAFDAFEGAHSLTTLNLSHNSQLSFLHPQLLAPLTELVELDLRSDNLQALSHITFHSNPHLARLFLSNNPWQCGCGLAWLKRESQGNDSVVVDSTQVQCQLQSNLSTVPISQVSQEMMQCNNVSLVNVTGVVSAKIGSRVVLRCDYEADETGVLTWTTPRGRTFHYHPFHPEATAHLVDEEQAENLSSEYHKQHSWHWEGGYDADLQYHPDHIVLLSDGSLYVDFVLRNDAGPYVCRIHNSNHNASAAITLHLDYEVLFNTKIMSLVAGMGCAASFFTLNTVYSTIMWCARKLVNKRRRERINKLLVNLDDYRTSQIMRIRTNYSFQLGRIRDHYNMQSARLKDNYTMQVRRVRQGYSNQVDRIRDNYHIRLSHLKDYSSHQIHQIREVTNGQIVRIRDYGSLQMERLRETYKLQQQHVIKVLEAMNLENCRTVVETECMRTESMIFDVNLPDLEDVDTTSSEEVYSQLSQSESLYVTALNSDNSSSLDTVQAGPHVHPVPPESLIIEVPPHTPPLSVTPPVQNLPTDSCSFSGECGNDAYSSSAEDIVNKRDTKTSNESDTSPEATNVEVSVDIRETVL
ncbi:leucine-rich repeat neuronal protein 1-like [Littorina saxatilis]|uniref:Ig-like domain-containing protein n=1 Tax=Littorina saxatilis TaxID=31220 RepID=A0AAN9ALM7_9CAEN